MRRYLFIIALILALPLLSCAVSPERGEPKAPIVLVSYGIFPTEDLEAFETLAQDVRDAFPGHALRWAFTDKTMVDQVRRDKIVFFTEEADGREPYDVLQQLSSEGYRKVLLQPLAMVPTKEMETLEALRYRDMTVMVGRPLMASERDIAPVVDALEAEIEEHDTTIVAAPGDADYAPGERLLVAFAEAVESRHPNAFVMSAEGRPGERRLQEAKVRARETGEVHIIPFTFLPREKSVTHRVFEREETFRALIANPRASYGQVMVEKDAMRDLFLERLGKSMRQY